MNILDDCFGWLFQITFPDDCSRWLFRMTIPDAYFRWLFQMTVPGWLFVIQGLIQILATNSYFYGRFLFQPIIRLIGTTTDSFLNHGFLLQNYSPDPPLTEISHWKHLPTTACVKTFHVTAKGMRHKCFLKISKLYQCASGRRFYADWTLISFSIFKLLHFRNIAVLKSHEKLKLHFTYSFIVKQQIRNICYISSIKNFENYYFFRVKYVLSEYI